MKVGEDVALTDGFRDGVRVGNLVGLRRKPKELTLPLTEEFSTLIADELNTTATESLEFTDENFSCCKNALTL